MALNLDLFLIPKEDRVTCTSLEQEKNQLTYQLEKKARL